MIFVCRRTKRGKVQVASIPPYIPRQYVIIKYGFMIERALYTEEEASFVLYKRGSGKVTSISFTYLIINVCCILLTNIKNMFIH